LIPPAPGNGSHVDLKAVDGVSGLNGVGKTGRDTSKHRKFDHSISPFGAARLKSDRPIGAGLPGNADDRALGLKGFEVPHHRVGAFESELSLNLPDARPKALIRLMPADKLKDFSLTFS
jgi:hypothetical protein